MRGWDRLYDAFLAERWLNKDLGLNPILTAAILGRPSFAAWSQPSKLVKGLAKNGFWKTAEARALGQSRFESVRNLAEKFLTTPKEVIENEN